jgi:NADH-quinone oxidoreductase subunit M
MGGYGFLRFSLPMMPHASLVFAPLVFALSVVAVIYTSLVALAQEDMKKLIAYSSVAHMGLVTMGIFSLTQQGIDGGIFQMLSHGIISGALFLCVGVVYDRMHTREISAYGGLVERMPVYAACFMVFTLANMGLPGTSGFVGEFLTMLGTFQVNTWVVIFAATGVILSAAYMLFLYGRVIFGALVKPALMAIQDLSAREIAILTPLVAFTIILGVYPKIVFDATSVSVAHLVAQEKNALGTLPAREAKLHVMVPSTTARSPSPTLRAGEENAQVSAHALSSPAARGGGGERRIAARDGGAPLNLGAAP